RHPDLRSSRVDGLLTVPAFELGLMRPKPPQEVVHVLLRDPADRAPDSGRAQRPVDQPPDRVEHALRRVDHAVYEEVLRLPDKPLNPPDDPAFSEAGENSAGVARQPERLHDRLILAAPVDEVDQGQVVPDRSRVDYVLVPAEPREHVVSLRGRSDVNLPAGGEPGSGRKGARSDEGRDLIPYRLDPLRVHGLDHEANGLHGKIFDLVPDTANEVLRRLERLADQ